MGCHQIFTLFPLNYILMHESLSKASAYDIYIYFSFVFFFGRRGCFYTLFLFSFFFLFFLFLALAIFQQHFQFTNAYPKLIFLHKSYITQSCRARVGSVWLRVNMMVYINKGLQAQKGLTTDESNIKGG